MLTRATILQFMFPGNKLNKLKPFLINSVGYWDTLCVVQFQRENGGGNDCYVSRMVYVVIMSCRGRAAAVVVVVVLLREGVALSGSL